MSWAVPNVVMVENSRIWVALAVSTTSWFALDTTIVLMAGALPFAVFNIAVMLAADVALIATYRQFFPARSAARA